MDVSPSRNSTHSSSKHAGISSSIRKENSKTIPKLCGEQILKNKTEATSRSEIDLGSNTNPTETKTNASGPKSLSPSTAHTKIPMKRTPISNVGAKTVAPPRALQRQQLKSASKISLTIKEVGGNKRLEQNASKLSFKANTSTNLRPGMAKNLSVRGQTTTGISRRSASTVSSRSSRSQKNEELLLAKVTSSAGDHEGPNLSARERVAENNKLKVFENLQKKLQEMQSDFMQKFESLKLSSPEKLNGDYKFIGMTKNDECKLIIKEDFLQKMPKKLPVESINDFKEKVKRALDSCLMSLMDSLKVVHNIKNEKERALNLEDMHNKLEAEQALKLQELFECFNVLCTARDPEMDAQIVKMQKEIQEGKKSLHASEKEFADLRAAHQEELETLEKTLKERTEADGLKRELQIAELSKKLKTLEKHHEKLKSTLQQNAEENSHDKNDKAKLSDELKACKDNIHSLNKKLAHAEQQLNHEKRDKQEKNEAIHKLEAELEATKKKLEDQQIMGHCDFDVSRDYESANDVQKLKSALENLECENRKLENQLEQIRHESRNTDEMRLKLREAEERICALQEREKVFEERTDAPKEYQTELLKLRQSESEKRREIEKLKVELSKAHFNICQLEEQIQRDQQLLEVRSELINSLQTNDNSQRIHLEEMFAQVGEKNNTINEVGLNNELRTKSEEFRNLFTTLSTKQMELSRQEHMIKLLEESNERSQMLRVKQEEKIGRMEEEIAHLKQTVAIYQNSVLGNAGCKNLLFPPVTAPEDYNENFYYYTSERRRKRQVDINVKKYET